MNWAKLKHVFFVCGILEINSHRVYSLLLWYICIQACYVHWDKYDVRWDFFIFYDINIVGSIFKIRLLLLCYRLKEFVDKWW